MRVARIGVLSASIAALLGACTAFRAEDVSTNGDADAAGGGEGGADAAGGSGPDGSGPADAEPGPLPDGGILGDGAIAPFGSTCRIGDVHEVEPNDEAGTATVFTSAVCGELTGADVDHLQIDVDGTSTVRVGWSRSGNASLTIAGPGQTFSPGAKSNGGFDEYTLTNNKPPGRFSFTVSGGVEPQVYRLFVTQ